ncbi:MAG: hypothetical protein RR465_04725 [Mucinivorans sp.]
MKKLLFVALIALISIGAMGQKTANEIIERYNQVTGLSKADFSIGSMMMDVSLSSPQGKIPMQVIKAEGAKYRIEASMMGQEMLAVANGQKGWIKVAGQPVQAMPKEAIDQMASQGDMTGSLKLDDKLFEFVLTGSEGGNYILLGTPRPGANTLGVTELVAHFSEKTGLMTRSISKLDVKGQKITVDVKLSGHKDFGGLTLPATMEVTTTGTPPMVLTVNDFKLNYPTAAWMFVEPK